jgi:two-component system NtrC family sensor kinase
LLVDDERSIRETLSLILAKAGYEVVTAEDLKSAFGQCKNGPWDVVLTDLILPDGSGIDLLRCVRESGSEIPVIAITGEPNVETAVEAVRLGAYDYVSKPIRRETLVTVVGRAVEKHRLIRDNQRYRENLERLVEERTAELIASEQRYRELIEQAPAMIYQIDEEGRFLTANQTQLARLGYRLGELLGVPLAEICSPSQGDRVAAHLRRVREQGSGELEVEFVCKDGRRLNVEVRATAVQDEAGDFLLSRGFAYDVTARKQLEMQLIHADKLSTIGLMVSGVAHELNNPLTGICGYAEMLLQDEGLSPDLYATLRLIHSEGERATRIVKNLLSFVRTGGGRATDYFDLHSTIDSVIDLMGYRLRRSEVAVERDFDPDVAPLFGDMHQLQQVLLNLVHNAIQAMGGGGRPARLRLVTRMARDEVMVQVVDTGHGIAPADLAHVFDPFFTTKAEGEGTGLGLSISRAAVEAHGGRIGVESRVREGTTFTIWLPITVGHRREACVDAAPVAETAIPVDSAGAVLVVDDELHVRNWLEKILMGFGYRVNVATSGAEALTHLAENEYGAVLTDYMMPGLNGIRLYEELRHSYPYLSGKLVMMSGAIDPQLDRFLRDHQIPFLQKPFNAEQLLETLSRIASHAPVART